jgi:hypothetical protein
LTVKLALLLPPLAVAETVTLVDAPTVLVITGKLARELPAATVTFAGIELTAAAPAVTVSFTIVSWFTAAGNTTVPVVLLPPVTVVGENEREDGVIALTVKVNFFVTPFRVAEIWTFVAAVI